MSTKPMIQDETFTDMIVGPMIYTMLSRVMKDIGSVSKDRKNTQQGYSFRGIEDMYLAAHPALTRHGVFCAPTVLEREVYRFEKVNDQGRATTWVHVALKVEHRFYAQDGSSVAVTTWGEGLDNSDKASNKAMSGAMKYALIELFCVPTADIEDSDQTSPETGMRRSPTTTQPVTFTKKEGLKPVESATASVKEALIEAAQRPQPRDMEQAQPELEPESGEYITMGQRRNIHREFKEALPEHLKKDVETILGAWLVTSGFYEVVGEGPNAVRKGTTKNIEAHLFEEIKGRALMYARKCV